MSDHRYQSIEVATETGGFAELDSLGVPDDSGLTFTAIPSIRAPRFSEGLETPKAELDLDGPHGSTPRPIPVQPVNPDSSARWGAAAGERMRVLRGGHTIAIPMYGEGAGGSIDGPLYDILDSTFGRLDPPQAQHEDVISSVTDANTLVMTNIDRFSVGMMVYVVQDGINEFRVITDIVTATSTIKVQPAFSSAPSATETLYCCTTYYPIQGITPDTLAFRMRMEGREMVSFGNRVSALTIGADDNGVGLATFTTRCAGAFRNDAGAGAVQTWSQEPGLPMTFEQSQHVCSADISSASSPAAVAVSDFALQSWSAEFSVRLSPDPQTSNVLGMDELRILSTELKLSGVTFDGSIIETMLHNEEDRTIVVSLGPVGEGQGMGLALMAGHNMADSLPEGGEDDRQAHNFELRAGPYALDDTTDQSSAAANTAWRIGFPMAD